MCSVRLSCRVEQQRSLWCGKGSQSQRGNHALAPLTGHRDPHPLTETGEPHPARVEGRGVKAKFKAVVEQHRTRPGRRVEAANCGLHGTEAS